MDSQNWLWYGTKDLQLVPFMPGTPIYRDGVLSTLYYSTKEEGKLKTVFCGDELNHDQFIAYFQKAKVLQVLCRVEANKDLKPRGYCWLDNAKGVDGARSAMCGFCFFGDATEDAAARDLGMLGLAYWFTALRVDVIHGIMLESNIPGRNFAQKLGFTQCAIVPSYHALDGKLVSARVMICDEAGWMPMFEQWREQNPVAPSE
jgi:hypothetical protein